MQTELLCAFETKTEGWLVDLKLVKVSCNFIAGRHPKVALLFWYFGGFLPSLTCDV